MQSLAAQSSERARDASALHDACASAAVAQLRSAQQCTRCMYACVALALASCASTSWLLHCQWATVYRVWRLRHARRVRVYRVLTGMSAAALVAAAAVVYTPRVGLVASRTHARNMARVYDAHAVQALVLRQNYATLHVWASARAASAHTHTATAADKNNDDGDDSDVTGTSHTLARDAWHHVVVDEEHEDEGGDVDSCAAAREGTTSSSLQLHSNNKGAHGSSAHDTLPQPQSSSSQLPPACRRRVYDATATDAQLWRALHACNIALHTLMAQHNVDGNDRCR